MTFSGKNTDPTDTVIIDFFFSFAVSFFIFALPLGNISLGVHSHNRCALVTWRNPLWVVIANLPSVSFSFVCWLVLLWTFGHSFLKRLILRYDSVRDLPGVRDRSTKRGT